MLVTPEVMQPYGFVHGGATLALLETAASLGAAQSFDAASERPFGVDVQVRHRKPGRAGTLRGVADLARTEPSRAAASSSSGPLRPTTTRATSFRRAA